MGTGPEAGWYDDGHGKQRWWDGTRWGEQFVDLSEPEVQLHAGSDAQDSFAGIVVDGRGIRFGALSSPIAGAAAYVETGAELLRRGRLGRPATARVLYGPAGPITPRLLARSVSRETGYVLVEVAGQVWLAPFPSGQEVQAGRFVAWVNASGQHYLYR